MKRYGQPIFIWYKRQSFNVRGICYQHVGFNRVLLSGTRLKKSFPKHTRQQQMNGFIAITPSAVYSLWSNPRISYRNNIQSKHLRRKSWFPWPIAAIFDNLIKMQCITSEVGLQQSCSRGIFKRSENTPWKTGHILDERISYINCKINEMDIVRIGINTILLPSAFILIDITLPKLMQCDIEHQFIRRF